MCRLYIFHANEPTKVECPLIYAQNALMAQSAEDQGGLSHTHGWGIATYDDDFPKADRRAWAAYEGEQFERAATRIYSKTVLAHVRRATIGKPALRNTHPFLHDFWAFAHNGTIPGFKLFKDKMITEIDEAYRPSILGETDSEHVFYFILTYCQQFPNNPVIENIREVIRKIYQWSEEHAPGKPMGLNMILTDGQNIYGSRIGRSLFYAEHKGVYSCEICGFPHIHHTPSVSYRAIDIASEPITSDDWIEIPEQSLFHVDNRFKLQVNALKMKE